MTYPENIRAATEARLEIVSRIAKARRLAESIERRERLYGRPGGIRVNPRRERNT